MAHSIPIGRVAQSIGWQWLPPAIPAIVIGAYLNPDGFLERTAALIVMIVAYTAAIVCWTEVLKLVERDEASDEGSPETEG